MALGRSAAALLAHLQALRLGWDLETALPRRRRPGVPGDFFQAAKAEGLRNRAGRVGRVARADFTDCNEEGRESTGARPGWVDRPGIFATGREAARPRRSSDGAARKVDEPGPGRVDVRCVAATVRRRQIRAGQTLPGGSLAEFYAVRRVLQQLRGGHGDGGGVWPRVTGAGGPPGPTVIQTTLPGPGPGGPLDRAAGPDPFGRTLCGRGHQHRLWSRERERGMA